MLKIIIIFLSIIFNSEYPVLVSGYKYKGYIYSTEYLEKIRQVKILNGYTPKVKDVILFEKNILNMFDTLKKNPLTFYPTFKHGIRNKNLQKYVRLYSGIMFEGDTVLVVNFIYKKRFNDEVKIYGASYESDINELYFICMYNISKKKIFRIDI